jgi:hypothetical protein
MSISHLADIVAIIHVAFVVFVLGGFATFLAADIARVQWAGSPVFRSLHLLVVGYTLMRVWLAAPCPLTIVEDGLRQRGRSSLSPVAAFAHKLVFNGADHRQFQVSVSIFAAMVLISAMTSASIRATALRSLQHNPPCEEMSA